ncbi:MAG: class I SAM-dependent methyltransferase [Candidatus Sulfopaludibacter sp.]|nr:class I SAM-dependent methyltransferase [Candidatus Sulfopaludibacter sp.]
MASHAPSTEPASPALVFDTLFAYQKTAALRAAIELDLFRAIGDGPCDAACLAQRCGTSERGTRILCDYLVVQGFLFKQDGIYRHTPTSEQFLDPRSPACVASTARFLTMPAMQEPLDRLAEIVRTGRTVLPGDGTVEPDNPVWVEFAHSMAPMMAPVAAPLGQTVLRWRSGPMRVLDIAAGHGLFGIEIAKQNPEATIVAQDWARVLDVAHENARRAGVAGRYQGLPGSAFEVEYGGPYDAILITNFLHHFDEPTCVGLLKKVRAALKPGGVAATLEFVPNEDRVSPPMPAAFALTMLASTADGDAYTFAQLERMHREAGFASVEPPVGMGPHSVVIGRNY